MGGFFQDFKYAARVLSKNPGVTAIMIFTLALAIGATTAIFSVVYGVLLQPLPYPQPDKIMAVWEINTKNHNMRLADPNFDDFRNQSHSFKAMAKYTAYEVPISGGSQPTSTASTPRWASFSPANIRTTSTPGTRPLSPACTWGSGPSLPNTR